MISVEKVPRIRVRQPRNPFSLATGSENAHDHQNAKLARDRWLENINDGTESEDELSREEDEVEPSRVSGVIVI